MSRSASAIRSSVLASAVVLFSVAAVAVDGVVLIDQNKALAGSVTPGDLPGFPISINQPGSYRLAGNLTLPNANTSGIEINVQNVTLDLNGFAILGPVTCSEFPTISCSTTGTGHGIRSSVFANVLIRNGFVQGMGGDGMFVLGGTVESIQATQNAGTGINVTAGIVRDSIARDNGRAGIAMGFGSLLRFSQALQTITICFHPGLRVRMASVADAVAAVASFITAVSAFRAQCRFRLSGRCFRSAYPSPAF